MRNSIAHAVPLALALTAIACSTGLQRAHAQGGALVVNGETIADAQTYAAAKKEGTLVVYTGNLVAAMEPVLKGFEADTGLRTNLVRVPSEILFSASTPNLPPASSAPITPS